VKKAPRMFSRAVWLPQEEHENGNVVGLDVSTGEPLDPVLSGIYDNYLVKKQILQSSPIIASQLLLVDEVGCTCLCKIRTSLASMLSRCQLFLLLYDICPPELIHAVVCTQVMRAGVNMRKGG
jgi:TCP-1/cpn60 chaperonin family